MGLVGGLDGGGLLLLLRGTLGDKDLVFGLLLLLTVHAPAVEAAEVTATLETKGSNETLDFGSLGVGLRIRLLLALNLSPDDVLPDIILLAQVEESPDLGSPLGTQPLGQDILCQAGKAVLTLLNNNEGEDGDIGADDAATNGFALALTGAAGAVA